MSEHFIEALSGELNKLAGRGGVVAATKRALELSRKARVQARQGAGLKGATKLGEDLSPELKKLEGRAKSMESKPNLLAKPPKPATPPPTVGANVKAKPMPSTGDNGVELKKTSSAHRRVMGVLMRKLGEGPAAVPPLTATPRPQTMEQTTKPTPMPTPKPPKPMPMPSTGTALTPMGKSAQDDSELQGAAAKIREMLESIQQNQNPGEYTDEEEMGVDDPRYGGGPGIKNFKGKVAPKFTDRFNPTDVPQAFGKKATVPSARYRAGANSLSDTELRVMQNADAMKPGGGRLPKPLAKKAMAPTPSKMIPKSTNASYGTGCGAKYGCGKGKHGTGCGLRRK